jgi:5'-3' exonuclease
MIYLIDASVFIFRAWFSIPPQMTDPSGAPVNAVYGYAGFLGDLLAQSRPERIAVAFDESLTTSFRNEIYAEYKANRELPPPELERQFALCRELTGLMGVAHFADACYEADDIIGSLAARMRKRGVRAVIVTRDKDLAQLLRDGDEFWNIVDKRRLGYDDVAAVFGALPERMADFQALVGDRTDNIPGVPGVGAKTAAVLMGAFESLEQLYDNLDQVPALPIRGAAAVARRLTEHRATVMLARRLTRIATDMPLPIESDGLRPGRPDVNGLLALYDRLGFGGRLRAQARRLADAG